METRKFALLSLAACMILALLSAPALAQTTHIVTVGDNFFSPSNLTIQVGDTVEWRNASGGNQHNVTANNGSFASQTSNSFTFSRTFNAASTVNYRCTLHAGMTGVITVQAPPPPGFLINAGLNDTWFNPATAGQGFFITVFPDIQKMFLAWFTYDKERPPQDVTAMLGEPGHRWLTAFGDYSGDTATLDVELTEGGIFNTVPPSPVQSPDGTITVEFTSCNAGEVNYNIPSSNSTGSVDIQRIALDNVPFCESLQPD